MDPTIQVAGVPASVQVRGDGFYVSATFQNVRINGSPVVLYFDPPVATVEEIDAPALVRGLAEAIARGALITL